MNEISITRKSARQLSRMKDLKRPDAPEGPSLGEAFWRDAKVVFPASGKQQLTLRLDADLLAWFKAGGRGYQSHINAVLRAHMLAHRDGR